MSVWYLLFLSLLQESSIVDASEDAQLQAAIKASLEQDKKNSSDSCDSGSEYDVDLETFTGSDDDSLPSPVKRTKFSEKKSSLSSSLLNRIGKLSSDSKSKTLCSQSSTVGDDMPHKSKTVSFSDSLSSTVVLESPCSSKKSTSPVPTKEASHPQWHKHLGSKDGNIYLFILLLEFVVYTRVMNDFTSKTRSRSLHEILPSVKN